MNFTTIELKYGDEWRLHRKIYNVAFNRKVSLDYIPMQVQKVHQMLQNLLTTPQDYSTHFEMYVMTVHKADGF